MNRYQIKRIEPGDTDFTDYAVVEAHSDLRARNVAAALESAYAGKFVSEKIASAWPREQGDTGDIFEYLGATEK